MQQNKLATIIQSNLKKTAGKQNYTRIHDNPKLAPVAKKKAIRYPTKDERRIVIKNIVDYEMHKQTSKETMLAQHKMSAYLDGAFPHFLTYQRHTKVVSITEEHIANTFSPGNWEALPTGIKNSFLRELSEYKSSWYKDVDMIGLVLTHQQNVMADYSDEQFNVIARIQEDLGVETMEKGRLFHTPVNIREHKGVFIATFTVYDNEPMPFTFKSAMRISDTDRGRLENRLLKYIGTAQLETQKAL